MLDGLLLATVTLLGICVILFAGDHRSTSKEIRALRNQVVTLETQSDYVDRFELQTLSSLIDLHD